MSAEFQRGIFALLCVLGVITVVVGIWLETARARRGESLLSPRHFRLRLISALIWIIILFSVAGLATIWFPGPPATKEQVLRSASVLSGVLWLITIALILLAGDMWLLARARRRVELQQSIQFSQQFRDLAETETARLRSEQEKSGKMQKVRAYPAPDSLTNGTGKSSPDASDVPE
jgi:cytochrome c-type biogenesis protein CcmH/NrfF